MHGADIADLLAHGSSARNKDFFYVFQFHILSSKRTPLFVKRYPHPHRFGFRSSFPAGESPFRLRKYESIGDTGQEYFTEFGESAIF